MIIRKGIKSLTIVFLILLSSCNKDEFTGQNVCVEISKNPDWITESFKTEFTIQLPSNYEGPGMIGFEGNTFFKKRVDDKIVFSYSFCRVLYCYDFGNVLDGGIANLVQVKDRENIDLMLDSKKEFCLNGNLLGIFFYNTDINATGIYYMQRTSGYLEGLTVYFKFTELQEVENIIKTITEEIIEE